MVNESTELMQKEREVLKGADYEALNSLRLIPSFLIFELRVSRAIPSLAAAPGGRPAAPPSWGYPRGPATKS